VLNSIKRSSETILVQCFTYGVYAESLPGRQCFTCFYCCADIPDLMYLYMDVTYKTCRIALLLIGQLSLSLSLLIILSDDTLNIQKPRHHIWQNDISHVMFKMLRNSRFRFQISGVQCNLTPHSTAKKRKALIKFLLCRNQHTRVILRDLRAA
jgi:hypothetical protein